MPRILASNLNFAPEGARQAIFDEHSVMRMSAGTLTDLTGEYGFGGIDYQAVRSPAYAQLRFAGSRLKILSREAEQPAAESASNEEQVEAADRPGAHRLLAATFILREGFRGVANPTPKGDSHERRDLAETKDSLPYSLQLWGSFPHSYKSFHRLQRTARNLGYSDQLNYVVYPDAEGSVGRDRHMAAACENNCLVQPTPDMLAAWRVDSPDGLVNELGERNLLVAYDPLQFTRQGKAVRWQLDQQVYLPRLLEEGLVKTLQLPLFRDDFRRVDPERTEMTFAEGRAFVRDQDLPRDPAGKNRDLATTFSILREHAWHGDVTIKATVGNLATSTALGFVTPAGIRRRFGYIIARAKQEMPQVEKSDWLPMPPSAWQPQRI